MDPLTHALSGALAARATAPHDSPLSMRARVAAGTAAAAFPDVDYVFNLASPIVYLEQHRGITHSILLLPLWAFALAWLFAKIARDRRGAAPWFGVCALGIGAHIVGDLITSYGTMILMPLTSARFGIGTTFIIDLWLSGLIVAGLVASLVWRRSRLPATVALAGIAGYIALQAWAMEEARAFGVRHAQSRGWAEARVVAHPRPVSPFNWTVFAIHGDVVEFAHVNVRRRNALPSPAPGAGFIARLDAAYRPVTDAQWHTRTRFGDAPAEIAPARSAWSSGALAFFRAFADIPVFDGVSAAGNCVWFRDLRFETPGRGTVPFRYGVCRDGAERWLLATSADRQARYSPPRSTVASTPAAAPAAIVAITPIRSRNNP